MPEPKTLPSRTRVKEIAMSYQQFQLSSRAIHSIPNTPASSPRAISRKSSATHSSIPPTPPSSSFSTPTKSGVPRSGRATSLNGPTMGETEIAVHTPPTPTSITSRPPPVALPPTAESTESTSQTTPLTQSEIDGALRTALTLQTDANRVRDKRPFVALLLGPDKITVLQTHFSISHVRHAESELARLAAVHYAPTYLQSCTLVSTWEPCAMCAGTIYWAGIGRVLYAASETRLQNLSDPGNVGNSILGLPCRAVFDAGQKHVEVVGPVASWEDKVVEDSGKWWREHHGSAFSAASSASGPPVDYSPRTGIHSTSQSIHSAPLIASIVSSIDEDGEYQADLDVDWLSSALR